MTKIGRKGFMLAEVVVVSVVISTALIGLYVGLNKVSSAYDTRNRYFDIDSLYIAMEINDILIRNGNSFNNVFRFNDEEFISYYKDITNDDITAFIVRYDERFKDLLEINYGKIKRKTFSEFLDYLEGHFVFDDDDYDYMIIVERMEDGNLNDCYYYALRLKYPY